MKCICKEEMKLVSCADNPEEGYAFNLYHCHYCDNVCKEDVWNHPGKIWILPSGVIKVESPENVLIKGLGT